MRACMSVGQTRASIDADSYQVMTQECMDIDGMSTNASSQEEYGDGREVNRKSVYYTIIVRRKHIFQQCCVSQSRRLRKLQIGQSVRCLFM